MNVRKFTSFPNFRYKIVRNFYSFVEEFRKPLELFFMSFQPFGQASEPKNFDELEHILGSYFFRVFPCVKSYKIRHVTARKITSIGAVVKIIYILVCLLAISRFY